MKGIKRVRKREEGIEGGGRGRRINLNANLPLSTHTFLISPFKVLWCSHLVLQGHHQPGNGHSLLLQECRLFLLPLHHNHPPHTPSLPLPLHKHLWLFKHLRFHFEVISRHLNSKCTLQQ